MEWPPKSLRRNGRKTWQSSWPTDASMPVRLSGKEQVGHHGLSLHELEGLLAPTSSSFKSNHHEATCQHGGVPSTCVPCPPVPSCRRHRPSWPLLAALYRPKQGRTEGRCPPPIGHRSTNGELSRAPPWPYHRSWTQQGPCRGVWRCIARWPTASRDTLARVRSGARARILSLPDRLHAALWRPLLLWCGHSPGSAWMSPSGRIPSLMLFQSGRPTKQCLSSNPAALCNSPKQPPGCSFAFSVLTTLSATVGSLWSITCRASAHDAQYAPGAILCALLMPKPPMRIGKEAMLRAMSCS